MTDLERMWDDMAASEPPTAAIVLQARRREIARRRRVRIGGVAAAVAAAFVAGVVVATPDHPATVRPVAFQADLRPAASCDTLLDSYRDRGLRQVSAYGWGGASSLEARSGAVEDAVPPAGGRYYATNGKAAPTDAQSSSDTGTNVQEAGVDEPDAVKTDGRLLVRMRGDRLAAYDVSGTTVRALGSLRLDTFESPELLLAGDTVVVLGADATVDANGQQRGSRVTTVSLADPAHPKAVSTVTYSAAIVSARQHGAVVRLVLASGLPNLHFVQPDGLTGDAAALERNRAAVRSSSIGDWLPTYTTDGDRRRLVDCRNVAIPPAAAGLDTVSIVGFDADAPDRPRTIALAGRTDISYESADHLYLASHAGWGAATDIGCVTCSMVDQGSGTSRIYDFALDGVDAAHVASGEVEGSIRDRWSMDEAAGVLRVAVGPSSETGDFNSVVTLRQDGQELVELGRLDDLGPGEQLKGMRWFDDLAVLVTFREVDPLFTVDLSDPAEPRLLGELKVPGFSAYLHPIGDNRLLGVGQSVDAEGSAQIALFDVADLTDARRTDVVAIARAYALAGDDPRTFTWLARQHTALVVVDHEGEALVIAVRVDGTNLVASQTRVDYGTDVWQVRTIGLPDGRIALVTGEEVEFFALS